MSYHSEDKTIKEEVNEEREKDEVKQKVERLKEKYEERIGAKEREVEVRHLKNVTNTNEDLEEEAGNHVG